MKATLPLLFLFYSLAATAKLSGQSAPVAIFAPDPEYPQMTRAAKVQGSCSLSLVVGQDGHTHDIQVVHSLEPTLDQRAVETVKDWTFKPAMKDGLPVSVRITVEVSFHIDPLLSSEILRDEIGDLGIKSDMIAYDHNALEILRQKGDRKYYEFALDKGAQRWSVSNVMLQLKDADPKHGKFSLTVIADQKDNPEEKP
jgi:TonB family protein